MTGTWRSRTLQTGVSATMAGAFCLAMAGPVSAQGVTYGDWSAAWWQWQEATYPDLDFGKGRVDCALGQSGPVWFLGGSSGGDPVTRRCDVEPNKRLFLPLVTAADFDDDESCKDPTACTVEEQREILDGIFSEHPAGILNSVACDLQIEVDSTPAVFSTPIVRTQSPPFFYDNNPENIADGFWVLLDPLPEGEHKIHFTGGICDIDTGDSLFFVDVTYKITVEELD